MRILPFQAWHAQAQASKILAENIDDPDEVRLRELGLMAPAVWLEWTPAEPSAEWLTGETYRLGVLKIVSPDRGIDDDWWVYRRTSPPLRQLVHALVLDFLDGKIPFADYRAKLWPLVPQMTASSIKRYGNSYTDSLTAASLGRYDNPIDFEKDLRWIKNSETGDWLPTHKLAQ